MTTRKPKAEQRRRDLCDAAVELLAADGARGLTHLRVDRRAGGEAEPEAVVGCGMFHIDVEVDAQHEAVVREVTARFGATIRG